MSSGGSSLTSSHVDSTHIIAPSPWPERLLAVPPMASSTSALIIGLPLLQIFPSRCSKTDSFSGEFACGDLAVVSFQGELDNNGRGNSLCFSNCSNASNDGFIGLWKSISQDGSVLFIGDSDPTRHKLLLYDGKLIKHLMYIAPLNTTSVNELGAKVKPVHHQVSFILCLHCICNELTVFQQ